MSGSSLRRRQEQEDEVDRTAVDRLIVDRLAQAREQTIGLRQAFNLGGGDGHTLAQARRAKLFALAERATYRRSLDAAPLRREVRELLQERPLVAARPAGLDRIAIEEVGKLHRGRNS